MPLLSQRKKKIFAANFENLLRIKDFDILKFLIKQIYNAAPALIKLEDLCCDSAASQAESFSCLKRNVGFVDQ